MGRARFALINYYECHYKGRLESVEWNGGMELLVEWCYSILVFHSAIPFQHSIPLVPDAPLRVGQVTTGFKQVSDLAGVSNLVTNLI